MRHARSVLTLLLGTGFLAVAILFPSAHADVDVGLTVHETPEGPPTASVPACSFYVKGFGLLASAGLVRVFDAGGSDPGREVAAAPLSAWTNAEGLFDILVGPLVVQGSLGGLVAVVDYDAPALEGPSSAPFRVECPAEPTCHVTWYLPPIGTPGHTSPDGLQRFRFGQTIPVKMRVDCEGLAIASAPRLYVADEGSSALAAHRPASSKVVPDNTMRWSGNHWHYNLDTRPMGRGVWQLAADLGGGADHGVRLVLG